MVSDVQTYEANRTPENGRKCGRELAQVEKQMHPLCKGKWGGFNDEEMQCAIFLHTIGEEALEVYDTFALTAEEATKLETIVNKLEAYYSPKKNVTYERYIFNACAQNGRSVDAFVTVLRQKAKTCEFGTLQDSLIKDRIVCGIDSDRVRERLLRNNEVNITGPYRHSRAAEISKTQIETIKSGPSLEAAAIKKNKKKQGEKNSKQKQERWDSEDLWTLWFYPQTKRMQSIRPSLPQM